jgi:hypothetical protein
MHPRARDSPTNMTLPANSSALHLGSQQISPMAGQGYVGETRMLSALLSMWHGRQFSFYLVRKFSMRQVKGRTTTNKGATF